LPELLIILVLAGVLMGPARIRQTALTLGRWTAKLQRISTEFSRQINTELDADGQQELKGAMDDVRLLKREVSTLKRQFTNIPTSLMREAGRSQGSTAGADSPEEAAGDSTAHESLPNVVDIEDDPA